MRRNPTTLFLATWLLLLPLPAQEAGRVVIGSKNFTESRLLGDLMALLLEEHTELEVEHRDSLGGTKICFEALRQGEIDLYAEYTGTAWAVQLGRTDKISDPLQAYLHVQGQYRERFDLDWLPPFGLENSYALALRSDRAAELGVKTISDLRSVGGDLRASFSIEFANRADGWLGLSEHYDLELAEVRSLEHGLAYEAIASGATDVIDAYTTDGKLKRYDLRVLVDDRAFFPPYTAAATVRRELLREQPQVAEVLGRLAFRISNETMSALNFAIEEEGRSFEEVARDFLESEGLLEPAQEQTDTSGHTGFLSFFLGRWRATLELLGEHLLLTLASVLLAALLAIPSGVWLTRHPRLARIALGGAGVVQTIPSLALLAFLIPIPWLGLSVRSAIVALFLYALLPILRNTVTGIRNVDPDLIDAARGLGLTPGEVLTRIQLPLAVRTIMAGVRTATVISIGVATLAAFIGAGGLGEPIVEGLYLNRTDLVLAGALPAALLALLADFGLARLEQAWTPRGLRLQAD